MTIELASDMNLDFDVRFLVRFWFLPQSNLRARIRAHA